MEWSTQLRQPGSEAGIRVVCKRLDVSFLPALLALDAEVYRNMAEKDNYMPAHKEELDYFFLIDARIYGVFCENKLAAYYTLWHHNSRVAVSPAMAGQIAGWGMYNLAEDLSFIPRQEWESTLEIHRALVHPTYHNLGLNQYFLPRIFQHVAELGYLHLTATISPFNCPSFISAMKSGLTIGGLKQKYQDVIRYIMYLDLTGKTGYAGKEIQCSHKDIPAQQHLLAAGYRGKAVYKDKAQIDLATGRPAVFIVYDTPCKKKV